MATIQFKAKIQSVYRGDSIAYEYVSVPELTRKHCNMHEFRLHPKLGAYANSDLFAAMLRRIRSELLRGKIGLQLNDLPDNVKIDTSKLLAVVTVTV